MYIERKDSTFVNLRDSTNDNKYFCTNYCLLIPICSKDLTG